MEEKKSPLYEGRIEMLKSEIQYLKDDLKDAIDDILLLKFAVIALIVMVVFYALVNNV